MSLVEGIVGDEAAVHTVGLLLGLVLIPVLLLLLPLLMAVVEVDMAVVPQIGED